MQAQLICIRCDVRKDCLSYRERTGSDYGIWGGVHTKRGEK